MKAIEVGYEGTLQVALIRQVATLVDQLGQQGQQISAISRQLAITVWVLKQYVKLTDYNDVVTADVSNHPITQLMHQILRMKLNLINK